MIERILFVVFNYKNVHKTENVVKSLYALKINIQFDILVVNVGADSNYHTVDSNVLIYNVDNTLNGNVLPPGNLSHSSAIQKVIDRYKYTYDYAVFMHDDINFKTFELTNFLNELIDKNYIIAGDFSDDRITANTWGKHFLRIHYAVIRSYFFSLNLKMFRTDFANVAFLNEWYTDVKKANDPLKIVEFHFSTTAYFIMLLKHLHKDHLIKKIQNVRDFIEHKEYALSV